MEISVRYLCTNERVERGKIRRLRVIHSFICSSSDLLVFFVSVHDCYYWNGSVYVRLTRYFGIQSRLNVGGFMFDTGSMDYMKVILHESDSAPSKFSGCYRQVENPS